MRANRPPWPGTRRCPRTRAAGWGGAGEPDPPARHCPLGFSLLDVHVGGLPLDFARAVPQERSGSFVLYDRGSLLEHYEVRADSMEQLFQFETLPALGGLFVRVAVDTELEVFAGAERFELANAFGRVGYSGAIVLDHLGRREEAATSFEGGVVEIRVSEAPLGRSTRERGGDIGAPLTEPGPRCVPLTGRARAAPGCWRPRAGATGVGHDAVCGGLPGPPDRRSRRARAGEPGGHGRCRERGASIPTTDHLPLEEEP